MIELTGIKEIDGKLRYEMRVFKPKKDWVEAEICQFDIKVYGPDEHRPYGVTGLMSVANYETEAKAEEAWEKL